MKNTPVNSRLHWPRDGVAVRVPPRRLASEPGARCTIIPFAGREAQPARSHRWDALGDGLPRGAAVVLLVAAEDVSFTAADVPALTGMRLREALPNLVEEKTVGDVGSLHVALGQPATEGRSRVLAVVDRGWLAAMQVQVVRSGHRVAAIVPESLAVPLVDGAWSLGCVGDGGGDESGPSLRCWLRSDAQQAMLLPADGASAAAVANALARQGGERPARLALYAAPSVAADGAAFGDAMARSLGVPLDAQTVATASDPFAAWLAGNGPDGGYGPPLSLLAFDGSGDGWKRASRWRIAAALVVAIVAVQVIGMQWEWRRLRNEAAALRAQAARQLTTAFPETRVVLDAPLQMSRGLAALRSTSGRSDPADFGTMMATSARIFAPLPSNALRGAEYEARAMRLRFAPGAAAAPDERERFTAAALQEGYVLRFDAAPNAAGESTATMKTRGGA